MQFALMFNVLEGGVIEAIQWAKENLSPERSIIVLDESSQSVWLWHGSKQGLVARRTALRQAESLKGHGYTVGKSIIGRDMKSIKEVDQRKIGRDPATDKLNEAFEELLGRKHRKLENFVVTFSMTESPPKGAKVEPKASPKQAPTSPVKFEPKPSVSTVSSTSSKTPIASEYQIEEPLPSTKPGSVSEIQLPDLKKNQESPQEEAKVAFVLKSVLEYYDDIWVSKKKDGSYAIEMMDGPVCQFSIKEGSIKFSANSFSGINPNIKTDIQKKFVELSKLI